jgi:hypothetical protein
LFFPSSVAFVDAVFLLSPARRDQSVSVLALRFAVVAILRADWIYR